MKRALLVTILGSAVCGACQPGVEPPSRGRQDITSHSGVFFSKEEEDRLREATAIQSERISRDQFGLLTVVVPIRSAVNRTLYLEYQYEFYDAAGRRIEGPTGWVPVTLEAGSPGTIQFTGTNPQAVDYRATVRFAR